VASDQSIERARGPLELPPDGGLEHARDALEPRQMPVAAVGHGDRFHLARRAQVTGVGHAVVVHMSNEIGQIHAPAAREMEAEEPVVVHGAAVSEVEQPNTLEGVAAHQRGGMVERRHPAPDRRRIVGLTHVAEVRPALPIEDDVAEDEFGIGGVETAHSDLHLVRGQPVIGVDELDKIPGRECDTFVERITDTKVGLADPVVLWAQSRAQQLDGAIVGATIDDHMLEIGERLRLDARDGLSEGPGRIEGDSDQCDPRPSDRAKRRRAGTEAPFGHSPIVVQAWRRHADLPGCRHDAEGASGWSEGIVPQATPTGSRARGSNLTSSEADVDRPARVVIISDFGDVTGGAAKVAISSARGLAELGIRVVFVCAVKPVSPILHHVNIDVRCFDLPGVWATRNPCTAALQGVWNADAARKLDELLRGETADGTIVHIHQWTKAFSPSVIGAVRARMLRSFISLHDYFLFCPNGAYFHFRRGLPCRLRPLSTACITANCDSRNYAFKAVRLIRHTTLHAALARQASSDLSVIHVSEFARSVAQPLLPPGTRHFVVPNPVEVARGRPVAVRDNTDFVFVGRFTPEKRCVLFARAALQAGIPATFLGAGPEEQMIRAANPGARILPWGSARKVEEVLSTARALVFPSVWYETSGLVVAEALARGVPAIVSSATAARDLIRDGVNGLLCEPGSLAALVANLRRLQDDERAAMMGENAFALYWANPLSVSAHLERLLAAYRSSGVGARESSCGSFSVRQS
jgi:glycosyltransferase involved in cell wall biosynthesis